MAEEQRLGGGGGGGGGRGGWRPGDGDGDRCRWARGNQNHLSSSTSGSGSSKEGKGGIGDKKIPLPLNIDKRERNVYKVTRTSGNADLDRSNELLVESYNKVANQRREVLQLLALKGRNDGEDRKNQMKDAIKELAKLTSVAQKAYILLKGRTGSNPEKFPPIFSKEPKLL